MADYLSLEDAAKKLGIPTDKLVELRSQGKVRGFRDGSSWKFPETSIEQLQDDLPDLLRGDSGFGSGILAGEGLSIGSGSVLGGDGGSSEEGSDLMVGGDSGDVSPGGSDVNLVMSEGEGSDVAIVASDSDLLLDSGGSGLLEIDSADLNLDEPAIMHDSAQLDLAIEPNAGSTGPVTDAELKEIASKHPDVLSDDESSNDSGVSSSIDMDEFNLNDGSGLSFTGADEEDSGEDMLGDSEDGSDLDVLVTGGSAAESVAGASSLEMLNDLNLSGDSNMPTAGSRGIDVLSELDLLGAEQAGSGLISGDSENLLVSSGLGSGLNVDDLSDSGVDDALADDDDLVIADDDDDLVISSAGSDISIAGDSGINLMSPSDSGLSLESEPLDLAGSSISALDLGAELSEGGSSGSGGGSGSMVDFQADEEFQLSPSGVGLDADIESGSQVIEVEDSAEVAEAVEFDDAGFGGENFGDGGFDQADPLGGDVFGASPEGGFEEVADDGDAIAIDQRATPAMASSGGMVMGGYEVPFSMLQCLTLMLILCVLSLGGMLMTDLVRNMWTYAEPSAPVSSLTDSLIGLMGWDK